jgi:hypothetical protein
MHPDHDTIANFRKTFLAEIQELFVEILLLAQVAEVLKIENISVDGSKIHADASKSKAVSYKRLGELETQLRQEVQELFELGEQADQGDLQLPEGLIIEDEIALRKQRLANLAEAKAVLEARAQERYEAEMAAYEAKQREREEQSRQTGRKPPGRKPKPPQPGARDKDQYNFTDPDSRIMKNSNNNGFDQHYNAQVAVDQESLLIVAPALSNHPNDKQEAEPTLAALSPKLSRCQNVLFTFCDAFTPMKTIFQCKKLFTTYLDQPKAAALDHGYFSEATIAALEKLGIDPYIAAGREPHHQSWQTFFAQTPEPPLPEASPKVKMAYKLQTDIGKAIYRLRKCTVEPVIGIIKEVMGFRQFSLRGLTAAAGEWCLVCLAFNLKRMHSLFQAQGLL